MSSYHRLATCFVLLASLVVGGIGCAADASARKFHPGHYVALDMSDDDASVILSVLRPGVQGVEKRYAWGDLEVRKDEYDFSQIAADLAVVESAGRQLVVFVFDKSFKNERYTPEYLWDSYTLPIRSATPGKGYISKRWDPYVVDRLNKLVSEIGARFDKNPHFEGIAFQESALGITDSILDREKYTPERYRDALVEMLRNARIAMPTSQIFWYMNFLARHQGLLRTVCSTVAPYDIVLGGPDVLPDSAPLRTHVYPVLISQDSLRFIAAQNDSFRHRHVSRSTGSRFWTPQEIFDFARDDLGVQYLFWNRVVRANPADSYDIDDAYPVMARYPQLNKNPSKSPTPAG